MIFSSFIQLVILHGGTPVVVSQAVLTLMLVVLGIIFIGIGYGFLTKTKENLLQHRWTMTAAIALTLCAVFIVMLPSFFAFYVDSDLEFFSALSYTTLIHGVIGLPAVTSALIYAFGDLPENTKKWMRITAILWITEVFFGVIMFFQMMELI
jgi:uncharacterized membrane protein YozB (DUF420 family)